MKNTIKYSLLLILAILFLYLFMPKKELYYGIEKILIKQNIIISDETLRDNIFDLEIIDGKLYFQDVYVTTLSLKIKSYLINNSVVFKPFEISDDFIAFFPKRIDSFKINYSLLQPKIVKIEAKGDFGFAKGYIDLFKKSIYFDVNISKLLKQRYKNILHQLKQNKKGGYFYEYQY